MKKICIFGLGYLGKSTLGILKDTNNYFIDPNKKKTKYKFLSNTIKRSNSLNGFDLYFICVPTNLVNNNLDISIIENILKQIPQKSKVIIRSTLYIGAFGYLSKKYKTIKLAYFPEFLRELKLEKDTLQPSRLILGGNTYKYIKNILKVKTKLIKCRNEEAEIIKIFSNAYLSVRNEFFNSLVDITSGLSKTKIIDGICSDYRIGNYYNKPRGYFSGKCLPKDLRSLVQTRKDLKLDYGLFESVYFSNEKRKRIFDK